MKVGAIVLATEQGLGFLAKDFYDNGIIHKVYVQPHSTRPSRLNWYRSEDRVGNPEDLLKECDTILFFETPFYWNLIPKAREHAVHTVLMPMYECTANPLPYEPELILAPSLLDFDIYQDKKPAFLPIPVHQNWKQRTTARVFIHNAGNGGLGGRNGTKELLEAMKYVKSPIKLIIRTQTGGFKSDDPRVEIRQGTVPEDELWNEGDVFVFPEKFNGLSLPLQEAYAAGMLVMCGDRYPMNTWLPHDPLIPIKGYKTEKIARGFQSAIIDPVDIASTIDKWYNQDISWYSNLGRLWGKAHSWSKLKKQYQDKLKNPLRV